MFSYEINPIGIVGTGVLDRPLIQQNLRTVREARPNAHRVGLCEIKHPDKPKFIGTIEITIVGSIHESTVKTELFRY